MSVMYLDHTSGVCILDSAGFLVRSRLCQESSLFIQLFNVCYPFVPPRVLEGNNITKEKVKRKRKCVQNSICDDEIISKVISIEDRVRTIWMQYSNQNKPWSSMRQWSTSHEQMAFGTDCMQLVAQESFSKTCVSLSTDITRALESPPRLFHELLYHPPSTDNMEKSPLLLEYSIEGQDQADALYYNIYPDSGFLMSELCLAEKLLLSQISHRGAFNLIVVDPPWVNKSVKVRRTYGTVDEEMQLVDLPVGQLILQEKQLSGSENGSLCGLVAIWCTNSAAAQNLCLHSLLPAWRLRLVATWVWLKITRHGDPVVPVQGNSHRLPYEILYLARPIAASRDIPQPPDHLVFASVPNLLHSSKPPLDDILKPYYDPATNQEPVRKLELFARQVRPGWLAWGNEPLLHNLKELVE